MTRIRTRGVPLDRRQLPSAPSVVGNLLVEELRDEALGRTIRQARLMPAMPKGEVPFPVLRCAELLWMGHDGFVLGGLEQDGESDVAQGWWCRLE